MSIQQIKSGVIADDAVTAAKLDDTSTQLFGFRNRIINGDMRIDQRYSGSSNTKNAGSGDTYHLDRWLAANAADGVYTIQQISDAPPGFINSLRITVTTADSSIGAAQINLIRQSIEGLNVSDLSWGTASAKTITLSFWVKSSLTGQFGGSLTNSAANRSRTYTYTINAANTWEYKTITIPGDTTGTWLTTNGVGIRCDWNLGTGSTYLAAPGSWNASNLVGATGDVNLISTLNATWQITGVQLEVGSVATPFERRPYGMELQLCQRYFQNDIFAYEGLESDNELSGVAYYKQKMRATPTLSAVVVGGIAGSPSGLLDRYNSQAQWWRNNTSPFYVEYLITASAEL